MKSDCCNAEMRVVSADEGTNFYCCSECGGACNANRFYKIAKTDPFPPDYDAEGAEEAIVKDTERRENNVNAVMRLLSGEEIYEAKIVLEEAARRL